MQHTVIIGNGISGITTARHLRKLSDCKITVISAESDYFFSRTAMMYVYMGHMPFENTQPYENWFWEKNRIELKRAYVKQIVPQERLLLFDDGAQMTYDQLVIASGSRPKMGAFPGKHFGGVQGLVSLQDLELLEENTRDCKRAVVVGGGLIGIELVEMLRSRGIEVTYLIREFKFWNRVLPVEESELLEHHFINDHGVDLRLGTELREITGNHNGRVKSVITVAGEEILCDFVGITIGVQPNIHFLEGSGIETAKGVLVNEFFETSVPGIYAIGDCAEFKEALPGRVKLEQIWYTGRMHGETLSRTLSGKKTKYQPVNFFNSAKLFDIEFQLYSRGMQMDPALSEVHWKSETEQKSIRVFFNKENGLFEGISLLGIRYRHEVCDRWLRENRNVEYVLQHLADANFDPEFFTRHEQDLIDIYNQRYGKQIQLKRKSWKRILGLS